MENGHPCPQCGTERAAPDGNRPGPGAPACDCARHAAEAHHADRTAELADAEDFNPLRIRPYVHLAGPQDEGPGAAPQGFHEQGPGSTETPYDDNTHPAARTMPLRPVHAAPPYGARPGGDTFADGPGGAPVAYADAPAPRRSRTVLFAAAAAVAVVAAGAAFASGAFDGGSEEPLALPAVSTSTPTLITEPASASAPSPTSSSAAPSATVSRTTRPTPVRASPTATPTRPPATASSKPPAPPATTAAPPPTAPAPPPPAATAPAASLAQGSSGPEVVELQERLSQEWLYSGPAHGRYTSRVADAVARFQSYTDIEDDPEGVYGPATRAALEARTREP
ncbi:peptidoglycan-binding protein [Streptomyces sp. NPDC058657]|uniref:peptidoglycan-binding domain-containing protein n=1 Tax=unclassified Streptomyces TaxID=2593676 RepID=UPI00365C2348